MAHRRKEDAGAAGELARLREDVDRMEQEEGLQADDSTSRLVHINQQLIQQVAELEQRLSKVEEENRDFASLCVQVQEQNEAITNLYVASQRLHATLDPDEVVKIISEILIELVGAEEFGVFLLEEAKEHLRLMVGEGLSERLPSESLPVDGGVIGEVATTGEPFFFEPKSPAEREARLPLAAMPLSLKGSTVGVVVIYKLLSHKTGFSRVDHQLLQLLAADAVTALVSARLHSATDRKLKTIEGFMNLMKSR